MQRNFRRYPTALKSDWCCTVIKVICIASYDLAVGLLSVSLHPSLVYVSYHSLILPVVSSCTGFPCNYFVHLFPPLWCPIPSLRFFPSLIPPHIVPLIFFFTHCQNISFRFHPHFSLHNTRNSLWASHSILLPRY